MIRFLREMNIWQTIESIGQQFHDTIKRNGDSYRLAPLTITLNFDILQVQNVSGIPGATDNLFSQFHRFHLFSISSIL